MTARSSPDLLALPPPADAPWVRASAHLTYRTLRESGPRRSPPASRWATPERHIGATDAPEPTTIDNGGKSHVFEHLLR
jgi:hypothetical protein